MQRRIDQTLFGQMRHEHAALKDNPHELSIFRDGRRRSQCLGAADAQGYFVLLFGNDHLPMTGSGGDKRTTTHTLSPPDGLDEWRVGETCIKFKLHASKT